MTIENYIKGLEKFKANLPEQVDSILMKNSKFIVGMLKLRLYNYGQDGNYDQIGYYTPSTKRRKDKKGQKADFITLRDSARFYDGMFMLAENGNYKISSTDSKTPLLIAEYGPAILELTYKQQTDIVENIIDPEIQKLLDDIGDIEITF